MASELSSGVSSRQNPKKGGNYSTVKNKWLKEFESVTVDETEVETLDAKENAGKTIDTAESSFAEMFEKSAQSTLQEGEVVEGTVVNVSDDFVTVDIGYKSEGLVPI